MTYLDLVDWRISRGLKLHELATLLGVSRQSVSAWEHGRTALPDDMDQRLDALRKVDTGGRGIKPDLPICMATHPQFYKKEKVGRRSYITRLRNHPYKAWSLDFEGGEEGFPPVVLNSFTTLDGQPLDIREVAHMPSGTVVKRDGLNWIVP